MPATTSMGGVRAEYDIEVKNLSGEPLYHEASIMFPELPPLPKPPDCYTIRCIEEYKYEIDQWGKECKRLAELFRMTHEYHRERCRYCMRHRNEKIEERYITGEATPETIGEIKQEIKKLRR